MDSSANESKEREALGEQCQPISDSFLDLFAHAKVVIMFLTLAVVWPIVMTSYFTLTFIGGTGYYFGPGHPVL